MGQKVGEIFVEFGIKGAEKMKDFAKDVGNMPLNVAGMVAAFGGLSLTFGGFMDDMLNMTKGLREFSAETGYGTDALEKWEQVGRRVGLSNAQVQTSFNSLVTGLTRLRTVGDESMVQWFSRMGIQDFMSATPDQLIAEMRARYQSQKTPAAKQDFVSYMRNLGVDPSLALAFQSPLSSPDRMARMSPMYGQSGQDSAAEFTRVISEVTDVFRRDFLDFFKQIEPDIPIIAKGLEESAKIITLALDHLFQLINVVGKVWKTPNMLDNLIDQATGNVASKPWLWKPGKGAPVTVNQHFYGDVDRDDIDTSTETLKGTLTKTMRMLGKAGQ